VVIDATLPHVGFLTRHFGFRQQIAAKSISGARLIRANFPLKCPPVSRGAAFSSEKAVSLPAARHMPVGSLLYAKPEHSRALKVVARASQSPWFDFTRGRG
jgi:hypothetical protein